MNSIRREYIKLIERYIIGIMSSSSFQEEFINKFKNETRSLDESTYEILDSLFGDADAFCVDPILYSELIKTKPNWYFSENQFRSAIIKHYNDLLGLK